MGKNIEKTVVCTVTATLAALIEVSNTLALMFNDVMRGITVDVVAMSTVMGQWDTCNEAHCKYLSECAEIEHLRVLQMNIVKGIEGSEKALKEYLNPSLKGDKETSKGRIARIKKNVPEGVLVSPVTGYPLHPATILMLSAEGMSQEQFDAFRAPSSQQTHLSSLKSHGIKYMRKDGRYFAEFING
jgi:hypothetical protein